MTSQVKCELFYSVTGEPFGLSGLKDTTIEHTPAIINIYTQEKEDVPDIALSDFPTNEVSTLSIPDTIRKGQFFNSETYCLFLNTSGQLLELDGQFLFKILMMRDIADPERLHIKFEQQYFPGKHQWKDVDKHSSVTPLPTF